MAGTAVVAHGGGPTPVINASLAGLIGEAQKNREVRALYGAQFGLTGLLEERFFDLFALPTESSKPCAWRPGPCSGSSRRPLTPAEDEQHFLECSARRDVRHFFYAGGNGSMETALRFHRLAREIGYELNVIGIPKTIDNDLDGNRPHAGPRFLRPLLCACGPRHRRG